jgi:hypothetical protein
MSDCEIANFSIPRASKEKLNKSSNQLANKNTQIDTVGALGLAANPMARCPGGPIIHSPH